MGNHTIDCRFCGEDMRGLSGVKGCDTQAEATRCGEYSARTACSMLFPKEEIPRSKPQRRMHVADAGQGSIRFVCGHCGHDTGWVRDEWTVTENRRGHPCPKCNDPHAHAHGDVPGRPSHD